MNTTLRDKLSPPCEQIKVGMQLANADNCVFPFSGSVFADLHDEKTGEFLAHFEKHNLIMLDAGILAARLFKDSQTPTAGRHNGITMLGVGTGATGNILSPDAPQPTQRRLNTELARKAFSSSTYRTSGGVAVSYPTNIVDFTATFTAAEAVGPLDEMALMYTASLNPAVTNPIVNGPSGYDPTIDVTGKDVIINYVTFPVISKPSTAILSIVWRLTF
jgi:hypothetical protein